MRAYVLPEPTRNAHHTSYACFIKRIYLEPFLKNIYYNCFQYDPCEESCSK